MEKIVLKTLLINTLFITTLFANTKGLLEINCLNCHNQQKIPSELIYRRYLLKYSTNENIKKQLIGYLKKPTKEKSIMPKQFFLKFPQKKPLNLSHTILNKSIDAYLDYFDIKKKLLLP